MTDLEVKICRCCPQHGFVAFIVIDGFVVYAVEGATTQAEAMTALEDGFAGLRLRDTPAEILTAAQEHREHILTVIRRMREMT